MARQPAARPARSSRSSTARCRAMEFSKRKWRVPAVSVSTFGMRSKSTEAKKAVCLVPRTGPGRTRCCRPARRDSARTCRGRCRRSTSSRYCPGVPGAVRGARRNGLVHPGGLVVELVVLPERADDAAHAPVVRRAQAELVLLVLVAARSSARWRSASSRWTSAWTLQRPIRAVALVVIGIDAARVIGVVAGLIDVAHEVAAGIDGLQIAELAVRRSTPCSRTCPCRRGLNSVTSSGCSGAPSEALGCW